MFIKKTLLTIITAATVLMPAHSYAILQVDDNAVTNDSIYYIRDDKDVNTCGPQQGNIALPANATIEQKIAAIMMIGVDTSQQAAAASAIGKYKIGGMYLLGDASDTNFNSAYFSSLNQAAGIPLIIASDEEGGQVQHFENVASVGAFPSAKELSAMSDADVEALGKKVGTGLRGAGVTTNLAPVLDLLTDQVNNADNLGDPSRSRAFSSDPNVITAKAGAFAKGLRSANVTPVLKHFPGIGRISGNTDNGPFDLPPIAQLGDDVKPYQTLASQNGSMVMLSNAYVPEWGELPVGVNPKAVAYLKAAPFNFSGLITTDDISRLGTYPGSRNIDLPTSVALALKAGVDLPLFNFPGDAGIQAIIDKVKADPEAVGKVDAAVAKVINFKNSQTGAATTNGVQGGNNAGCCNTGSAISGQDNAAVVYNFLIGKQVTSAIASGIIGNMIYESGIEPQRLQGVFDHLVPADQIAGSIVGGTGWGIVQWTPYSKMVNPVKAANQDPNQMAIQLDFLWGQLTGTGTGGQVSETGAWNKVKTETTPDGAAYSFAANYERFFTGTPQGEQAQSVERRKTAAIAYNEFATKGTPLPPDIQAEIATTAANGAPAATTPSSGATGGTCTAGGGTGSLSMYKNPLRGINNIIPHRIDGGVDYDGDAGPIYAVGPGVVVGVAVGGSSGWPGVPGLYLKYQLTDGPAKGKYIYMAEDCTPTVSVGDTLTADTVICNYAYKDAWMEMGWGAPGADHHGYVEWSDYNANGGGSFASNSGLDFSTFLVALGAPPGVIRDAGQSTTPPPADWPKWN